MKKRNVVRGLRYRLVKIQVALGERGQIPRSSCDMGAERGFELFQIGRRRSDGGQRCCMRLKHIAHLYEIPYGGRMSLQHLGQWLGERCLRQFRHHRAAVSRRFDQAARPQFRKRLPEGRPGHADLLCQFTL